MRLPICRTAIFCLASLAGSLGAQTKLVGVDVSSSVPPSESSSSATAGEGSVLPQGVALPRAGMVHAIDQTSTGPVLVPLHANEIVSHSHAVSNFMRSAVYGGPHASMDLQGASAVVQLQSPSCSFLVRISGDDPELLRERVRLIRLQPGKDRRQVAIHTQNIFGGQRSKQYEDVTVSKADVEQDVWLRVTPAEPLSPGEYGIAIMPKDTNLYPSVVYDFGVGRDTTAH